MADGINGSVPGRALIIGALLAILLAAIPAALDWYNNPAQLFRGPTGTDWAIVWETFWSWLWPLALATVPGAVVVSYLRRWMAAN